MRKYIGLFTVLALLAAASIPAMCHAMSEAEKAEKTAPPQAAPEAAAKTAKTTKEETAASAQAPKAPLAESPARRQPEANRPAAPSPIPPGAPYSFADIAEDLIPAVVNISSTMKARAPSTSLEETFPDMPQFPPGSPFGDFFEEFLGRRGEGGGAPAIPPASLGSGFVVDAKQGLIVTNNHVVKDAEEVRVTFQDDSTIPAKIIGKDEKMDLAVLKVETDKKLTQVEFGDSDRLRVGDWVLAIGNPFGLGGTVTAGIISAQQRDINAGQYDDFIQTDASINRGNSGGPMFNLQGEVIGINTAIFSPSGGSVGIGFAIPANLAKNVVAQLIEFGKTRRGWIGVRIQTVTEEIAESLSLPDAHGALVASITEGGPAAKTKLKAGDVIVEFDGKKVNAMRNLPRIVAETTIGKTVKFTYIRGGKRITDTITVDELEKAEEEGLLDAQPAPAQKQPSEGVELTDLGINIGSLSESTRRAFSVPADIEGVIVLKTDPAGEAASKGIAVGDVLVEINQEAVTTPKQAEDLIAGAKEEGKSSVLLLVGRESDMRFVALRFKK